MPLFVGFQQEIDRIIEKAGSFFCEEEDETTVLLEQVEVAEAVMPMPQQRNAYTYTKYPALLHGKYSIPKHWVSDEDVANVVITEDAPLKKKDRKENGHIQGVLRHVYQQLAF